jgi:DNA-binding NarL/FixJ family response regulator
MKTLLMETKINILIADDHQMFVDGLKRLLLTRPEFSIVGEAYDGFGAISLIEQNQVDILILDINMPGLDGMEVTRQVSRRFPAVKILILSMYTESTFATELLGQGACGYLIKNTGKDELFEAIHSVMENGHYVSKTALNKPLTLPPSLPAKEDLGKQFNLTKRETEILKLLVLGKTSPEIAENLYLAIYTVDTHRKNLLRKLNVKNTAGLVRFAIAHSLI